MSFFKKLFGGANRPDGTTQVYEVSKDVVRKFVGEAASTPGFMQLRRMHPTIPIDHLAMLMVSASETARKLPEGGENQAMDLAMKACTAYDQGRLMVSESSWSFHLFALTGSDEPEQS